MSRLYWQGQLALIKQIIGGLVMCLGVIALLIHWVLALVLVITGIWLIWTGKADRFDYQRASGSIIHQGDGRW